MEEVHFVKFDIIALVPVHFTLLYSCLLVCVRDPMVSRAPNFNIINNFVSTAKIPVQPI